MQAKRELIRIVRTDEGVKIDPSGKLPGRGAYLHEMRSCWANGIRASIARSLRTKLTPDDIDHLSSFMEGLPDENQSQDSDEK